MGLLANSLGIRALSVEDPAQPLLPYSALFESLGLGRSDAGVMVNEKQALRLTTCFNCINIISTDCSSLPVPIFQRMPDGSVREAREHSLWGLICEEASPTMSSMTFRGAWLASALGWGNGYAFIRRDRASRAVGLQPLPSDKTSPVLAKGKLMYATTATDDGLPAFIDPANVLHLSGFSMDGIVGFSPVQMCKNAYGLGIAAEKFGAQFYGNGARATGVLTHPETLDAEAYENLKKSVRELATGESALRPLILEEGMKWEQMSIAPNDAQFLETRRFQRSEIAGIYRVAMHLLQDLERATNNNIEHQSLDHLRYCLRPWLVRMEQEITRKLLSGSFYVEHDMNAFQRGDFASQTAGFALLRNTGVYSANDILRALRQNPIPAAEGGDVRLAPLNMVSLETLAAERELPAQPGAGKPGGKPPADETTDSDQGEAITDLRRTRIANAYARLFRDAFGRLANRKGYDAKFAYRAMQPIVASMAEAVLSMYLAGAPVLGEDDLAAAGRIAEAIAADSRAASLAGEDANSLASRFAGRAHDELKQVLIGGNRP